MAGIETVLSGQSVAKVSHSSSGQKSSHGYLLSLPIMMYIVCITYTSTNGERYA